MKTISPPSGLDLPKGWAFFSALRLESHPSGGFPVFLIAACPPSRAAPRRAGLPLRIKTSLRVPRFSKERSEWVVPKSKQRTLLISKEI